MASKTASQREKQVGIKPAELRSNSNFKRRLLVTGAIVLGVGAGLFAAKSALAEDKTPAQEPKKDNVELAAVTEVKPDTTKAGQPYWAPTKEHPFGGPSPKYKAFVEKYGAAVEERTNKSKQLIQEIRAGRILTDSEISALIESGQVFRNDLEADVPSLEREREDLKISFAANNDYDVLTISSLTKLELAILIKTQNPSYQPPPSR